MLHLKKYYNENVTHVRTVEVSAFTQVCLYRNPRQRVCLNNILKTATLWTHLFSENSLLSQSV